MMITIWIILTTINNNNTYIYYNIYYKIYSMQKPGVKGTIIVRPHKVGPPFFR